MTRFHRHASLRGYSLVEMTIVLLVIGVVLSALWIAADQAWEYSRREQTREAITTTVTNARSYFGGQEGIPTTATAALTSLMVSTNVIPSQLVRPGGCGGSFCADNPWGPFSGGAQSATGTFQVCNWTLGTGCGTAAISPFFGIILSGLYKKNCVALVQMMSSATQPTGLVDININGSNLVALNKPITPVTDADSIAYCTPAVTPDPGTGMVTFVYRVVAPSL